MAKLKGDEDDNQVEPPLLSYEKFEELSSMTGVYRMSAHVFVCILMALVVLVFAFGLMEFKKAQYLWMLFPIAMLIALCASTLMYLLTPVFHDAVWVLYPDYLHRRFGWESTPDDDVIKKEEQTARATVKKWLAFYPLGKIWKTEWELWGCSWLDWFMSIYNGIWNVIRSAFNIVACFDAINCSLCGTSFSCRKNKEKRKNIK